MPTRIRGTAYIGIANELKVKSIHPIDYFELAKSRNPNIINSNKFVRRSAKELSNFVKSGALINQPIKVEHEELNRRVYGVVGSITFAEVNPRNPLELKFEADIRNELKHLLKKKPYVSLNFKVNPDGTSVINELSLTDDPYDERCTYDVIHSINSRSNSVTCIGKIDEIYTPTDVDTNFTQDQFFKWNGGLKLNETKYINLDGRDPYKNTYQETFSIVKMQQRGGGGQQQQFQPSFQGGGGGVPQQQQKQRPQQQRQMMNPQKQQQPMVGGGGFNTQQRPSSFMYGKYQQPSMNVGPNQQRMVMSNPQFQQQQPQQQRQMMNPQQQQQQKFGGGGGGYQSQQGGNKMMGMRNGNGHGNGNGRHANFDQLQNMLTNISDREKNFLTQNTDYYKEVLGPVLGKNPHQQDQQYSDIMNAVYARRTGRLGKTKRNDRVLDLLLGTVDRSVENLKTQRKMRKVGGGQQQPGQYHGQPMQQQPMQQQPMNQMMTMMGGGGGGGGGFIPTGNQRLDSMNQQYLDQMEQEVPFSYNSTGGKGGGGGNPTYNFGRNEVIAMHNKVGRYFGDSTGFGVGKGNVDTNDGMNMFNGVLTQAVQTGKYMNPNVPKLRKNDEDQYGNLKEDEFRYTTKQKQGNFNLLLS